MRSHLDGKLSLNLFFGFHGSCDFINYYRIKDPFDLSTETILTWYEFNNLNVAILSVTLLILKSYPEPLNNSGLPSTHVIYRDLYCAF